jgi:hypothetical protein
VQPKIYTMGVVPIERLDESGLEALVTHQVALREGRPFVRRMSLLAVEHYVSVEAAVPKLLHGLAGSKAAADYD